LGWGRYRRRFPENGVRPRPGRQLQLAGLGGRQNSPALLDVETDFSGAEPETLCRFITTIVRADRFNDGFLVQCFENGQIAKILLALRDKVFPK
jgi:hypothetical protein